MKQRTYDVNADSKANVYALRCFCIAMAAFAFSWVLNQLNIFIVDKSTMTRGFLLALGLFAICIGTCAVFGLNGKNMKYVLLFFIIAIITVIEVMLTYHSVILSVIPIVYSAMYQNTKKMTTYTFLLTIVSIVIIVFGGYYWGLCDANMALLTSKPLAGYITEAGTFSLNTINENPLLTLSLYFVFPRCIICGVFVPICINISEIIAESRIKEEEMRVLAEIDGMTGLYNKSKYLELIANPYSVEEKIAVIFWDVNGLKEINDNMGHEYGDKLITTVSESIKQISTPTEKAYRVGGDEFVMILRGANEEYVQDKVRRWQEQIQGRSIENRIPVSAAVGYACGSGSDLEDIIRTADEMMYLNKNEFYKAAGKVRAAVDKVRVQN